MQQHSERLEYGAKIVLYIIAALLPIWFLPLPIGVEFAREITFEVLILVGAALWLLSVLSSGEIRLPRSLILYAAGALALIFGASVIFSKTPYVSLFLADASAERYITLVFGLALMLFAASVWREREEMQKAVMLLLITGGIAALINAVQFLFNIPLYGYIADFAGNTDFNVVGTANGLALFYGALFMVSLGFLLTDEGPVKIKWPFLVFAALFLVNLLLINFLTVWIVLLGSSIFFFGLLFKDIRKSGGRMSARYWVSFGVLVFLVVMIMIRSPLIKELTLPAEVAPSLRATLGIAGGTFKESVKNIIIGSGPGTFGLGWARHKDPSINQTIFWDVRFNQGSSWFSTLIPTAGVLGALAFLAFVGVSLITFLKSLLEKRGESDALAVGLFLGWISVVLAAFLYPANPTLLLLFFMTSGWLIAVFAYEGRGKDLWRVTGMNVPFEAPWAVFISSLAIVFLLSLGVARLYMDIGRVRSALAASAARAALQKGNVDEAVSAMERAVRLERSNFRNEQAMVQVRTEKIRSIVQRASRGENVQQEFQQAVSLAIQDSQRALQLAPEEPALWRAQGALYELVIPFIQGAEKFAFDSYTKAAEFDPLNPGIFVELGRARLTFADRLQILSAQTSGQERAQVEQARLAVLQEAIQAFTKAVDIKSDLAAAHFLLAQTALRAGDAKQAIASAEKARDSAPFDIGVAFQLGLLYYQNDELAKARSEFDRAVALNQNYSNARYFLGLIYDRQGEKARAIEEFEKVAVFNPDNQEVETILANLRAGKRALDGIAPPGVPPEQRSEAPIQR